MINLVKKWNETGNVGDKPRPNKQKLLISNRGILNINQALHKDPCLTARKIKAKLFLAASPKTIRRCIRKLGWKGNKFYHKFSPVLTQKFNVVPQKFLFTKN